MPLLPEARFAAPPGAETSKTDPTNEMYPRQQLFLTLRQLFQALDEDFEATRTPQPHCPSLRTLRALPPTLPRCHFRSEFYGTPPCAHFDFLS
jgi:hypothetical protein